MKHQKLIISIVILFCLLPVIIYCFLIGRSDSVSPTRAMELINDSAWCIVDIRDSAEYQAYHIPGSINWNFKAAIDDLSNHQFPLSLKDKKLLLICNSGINSAILQQKLAASTQVVSYSISGGLQKWKVVSGNQCPVKAMIFENRQKSDIKFPLKFSTMTDQRLIVITAFVLKPLYMLFSFILILLLIKKKSIEMVALRWSMIFFLAGEGFCALNYLFFNEESLLNEYLHCTGMVIAFSFAFYAFIEMLDRRIIKFSDINQKCTLLEICKSCTKTNPQTCKIRKSFYCFILLMIVVAFIPLHASLHPISYNTWIFKTLYSHIHPTIFQIFEIRFLPEVSIFSLIMAWLFLIKKEALKYAKIFISIAIGTLGFSFFRMVLYALFLENLAGFAVWEEITEFLFICGLIWLLKIWGVINLNLSWKKQMIK